MNSPPPESNNSLLPSVTEPSTFTFQINPDSSRSACGSGTTWPAPAALAATGSTSARRCAIPAWVTHRTIAAAMARRALHIVIGGLSLGRRGIGRGPGGLRFALLLFQLLQHRVDPLLRLRRLRVA